jgi:peptidoglycan/LPS O-acetylase OafA/YrhL
MPAAAAERLIRFLAGTTFRVYLMHFPLLNFFGTVIPGPADRATRGILVFGLTPRGSIVIAHLIEQQKGAFKRALRLGSMWFAGSTSAIFSSARDFPDPGRALGACSDAGGFSNDRSSSSEAR